MPVPGRGGARLRRADTYLALATALLTSRPSSCSANLTRGWARHRRLETGGRSEVGIKPNRYEWVSKTRYESQNSSRHRSVGEGQVTLQAVTGRQPGGGGVTAAASGAHGSPHGVKSATTRPAGTAPRSRTVPPTAPGSGSSRSRRCWTSPTTGPRRRGCRCPRSPRRRPARDPHQQRSDRRWPRIK